MFRSRSVTESLMVIQMIPICDTVYTIGLDFCYVVYCVANFDPEWVGPLGSKQKLFGLSKVTL